MQEESSTRSVSLHFSHVQQQEAKSATTRRVPRAHWFEQCECTSASRVAMTEPFVMFSWRAPPTSAR